MNDKEFKKVYIVYNFTIIESFIEHYGFIDSDSTILRIVEMTQENQSAIENWAKAYSGVIFNTREEAESAAIDKYISISRKLEKKFNDQISLISDRIQRINHNCFIKITEKEIKT
jgi:hypothetical protein